MSNHDDKAQDKAHVEDEVLVDVFAEEEEEIEEVEDESQDTDDKANTGDEDEFKLPEKFQGKSVKEIAESYINLEKEYGRRNSEVGQLRKLTDKLLELERPKEEKEEAEDTTIDADSLLDNPQEAIRKILANDPTLKELKAGEIERLRTEAKTQFETANPDYKTILKSDKFAEWVLKSDRRKQTFVDADANFDYATMDDMLSDFRELNPPASAEDKAEDDAGKEEKKEKDLKKITTEKRSKSKSSSKKIYSRDQLIEMRIKKPEEYARRHEEFMQAYAENRVR